jgi:hypothetical protein
MKRSKEAIRKLISITRNSKGRDQWFTGYCPFCGDPQEATIQSSDKMAELSIMGKIMAHISLNHTEEIKEE